MFGLAPQATKRSHPQIGHSLHSLLSQAPAYLPMVGSSQINLGRHSRSQKNFSCRAAEEEKRINANDAKGAKEENKF
jgi:hypothetical protein